MISARITVVSDSLIPSPVKKSRAATPVTAFFGMNFTGASTYATGRRVTVAQPDGIIEGTTAGLDPAGFLIVRRDDGTDTLILAGGVRAAGS